MRLLTTVVACFALVGLGALAVADAFCAAGLRDTVLVVFFFDDDFLRRWAELSVELSRARSSHRNERERVKDKGKCGG